jgi:hypothetical protein
LIFQCRLLREELEKEKESMQALERNNEALAATAHRARTALQDVDAAQVCLYVS